MSQIMGRSDATGWTVTCNNRSLGRCIRCEAMTRSYVGIKTVEGRVLCKHCSKSMDSVYNQL